MKHLEGSETGLSSLVKGGETSGEMEINSLQTCVAKILNNLYSSDK